jgi:hypothetical protein
MYTDKLGNFRACSKEHYLKLKKIKYVIHLSRIQSANHRRWAAKLPHNRLKWIFDGFYSPNALDISFTKWKSEIWKEPLLCPVNIDIWKKDFEIARKFYKSESEVEKLLLPESALDCLIESCEKWIATVNCNWRK